MKFQPDNFKENQRPSSLQKEGRTDCVPADSIGLRALPRMRVSPQSRDGVALVITLIMLSVITFLTVAFLAMSRRDRASVTTALNQTDSHFMADTALARVQSEMTARMMARGTLLAYDAMASRNYINPNGYVNRNNVIDTNNVSYVDVNGNPLNADDQIRNIANLFYDPRPPVFIKTNSNNSLPLDFRYYLDLNRNGRFETNGLQPVVVDENGNTSGLANFLGEPEWIGVLQDPERPHSPNNQFIGRYLYFAAPIGKTLDLNYIHNYAKGALGLGAAMPGNGDGFLRNQGVGSWELNLGGFLYDLNTNIYVNYSGTLYDYRNAVATRNEGIVFDDAVSFLGFRYDRSYVPANVGSVLDFFGNAGSRLRTDLTDSHSVGTAFASPDPDDVLIPQNRPWSGSRNPQQFFEPQEIFDSSKSSVHFANELARVSTNNNSYDRYTFSRLLEQIGTGSEPEVRGKININYTNDPALNIVNTNFVDWEPLAFFTNVAQRLLDQNLLEITQSNGSTNYYMFNTNNPVNPGFALTNIQLYPTNEYTAPVHRLLQLAANIYDATSTNKFPTVFRPRVERSGNETRIFEFVLATNSQFVTESLPPANPAGIQDRTNVINPDGLVWGVPLVVGAKKGFPSFNKFVAQTFVQVSRNLQLSKPTTNAAPNTTNQMIVIGISNVFAMEAWNSYIAPYTNRVRLITTNMTTMVLTNEFGTNVWPGGIQPRTYGNFTNFTHDSNWLGARSGPNAFIIPFTNNLVFLTNSQFVHNQTPAFSTDVSNFQNNNRYPNPTWGLAMTNRLVYVLTDISPEGGGRIIDFVNLDNMISHIDINEQLMGRDQNSPMADASDLEGLWRTNRLGGSMSDTVPTVGIQKQIEISMGMPPPNDTVWRAYGSQLNPNSRNDAIAKFTRFMGFTPNIQGYQGMAMPPDTVMQTPFNPTKKMVQTSYWQVNDPLVHYTVADLTDPKTQTNSVEFLIPPGATPTPARLRTISDRYRPWGSGFADRRVPGANGSTQEADYDFRVKDPRVRWSDDWDFPTNKFPNIGWLGRVHRGTPWQTVYLKAASVHTNAWRAWAGHFESHPTNDWKVMDLFTTSVNDNAARGLLSINQTNLAAWSAALSGVETLSNNVSQANLANQKTSFAKAGSVKMIIEPNSSELRKIVADINGTRQTNYNGTFKSLGDILAVPSLSMSSVVTMSNTTYYPSPYLNVFSSDQRMYGVDDETYERIPRQIMSLLKLGEPRFVVYSYGQSLKPAANSLVLDPPDDMYFNLCTNYQITGEVATRTVLRVEGTVQNPKVVIESYNILPQ